MKKDHYDILDIVENAPAEMVARAYQVQQGALNGDASLRDADRQKRLRALDEAYKTLSNPDLRAAYDEELSKKRGAGEARLKVLLQAVVVLAVIGAGTSYAVMDYQKKKAAQEEREQEAREEAVRQQKIAEDAEKRRLAVEQERAARLQAEQDRIENDRIEQEKLMQGHKFVTDNSTFNAEKARALAEQEKQRAAEDEANRRRAQAEIERQKRFLANNPR